MPHFQEALQDAFALLLCLLPFASIIVTQQLRCTNGNFVFPSANASIGSQNATWVQANPGGGQPGMIQAIATGQGTLVDLSTFSPAMSPGGWCMFRNADATITVTWGPDDGSGNLKPTGDMQAGEFAGPFRTAAGGVGKYRFKSASGTPEVQAFFLVP